METTCFLVVRAEGLTNCRGADRGGSHSDSIAFRATVRHSEATAQVTGEPGFWSMSWRMSCEKGLKWYEVVRGAALHRAGHHAPRTAGGVAEDLQSVTRELVTRITEAEAKDLA